MISRPGVTAIITMFDTHLLSRCRMFKWLPVYNFLVMFATLAYQAPFERLFGRFMSPDDKVLT